MELEELKSKLDDKPTVRFVNEHLFGDTILCPNNNVDRVYDLRKILNDYFSIPVRNVVLVGSAKLGISLSKSRFGAKYSEKSDMDMLIVSGTLFDKAWHDLLSFDWKYHKLSAPEKLLLKDSLDTIQRGFISPDRLPLTSSFRKFWWSIFENLSNKEEYEYRKIRGRLFKSWRFAERYYAINISKLRKGA